MEDTVRKDKSGKPYYPKVSIVIPAYNASNYLAQAIDSALSQTYSNLEIIVVNDGSKDNGATAAVAEAYGEKIRYFEKENGGSSSALNYGIQNMTGQWFSWLSHDDLYLPEKVEKQVEWLGKLPPQEREKTVLFSGSQLIDAAGKTLRRPPIAAMEKTARRINSIRDNAWLIAQPTENMFHGCSCLIHRSVFAKVGMFDESLRLINDADLWYRIYAAGYCVHYVPQILVKGRVHSQQLSRAIGFSYHNPEQDLFWNRSLQYLLDRKANEKLLVLFGKNACRKTRFAEADRAFRAAVQRKPGKAVFFSIQKYLSMLLGMLHAALKAMYLKWMR